MHYWTNKRPRRSRCVVSGLRLFGLRLLGLLLVGFCSSPLILAESLRVATYNLNNYLLTDRYVDSVWRPSYPKPEAEKTVIREVIRQTLPDILAVQEIGGRPFLEELRADLLQEGVHYPHLLHMQGADDLRHIAVLSKRLPLEVVKHQDLEFNYQNRRQPVRRGMLELSFARSNGTVFKLFVVHLKSRWSDLKQDPQSRLYRTREAEACRNRILARTHHIGMLNFLIAGDFNDHPVSAPLRRFYRKGGLNIGALVPATDSRGEQWTHFYRKQVVYSLVDGFIASCALAPDVKAGHGHIAEVSSISFGSDHRLVYLDLVEPAPIR